MAILIIDDNFTGLSLIEMFDISDGGFWELYVTFLVQ
jgi:hypothetical protein